VIHFIHCKYLDKDEVEKQYLLWAFYFMKTYVTMEVGSKFWKVTRKTYIKHVWRILFLLDDLMDEVNSFNVNNLDPIDLVRSHFQSTMMILWLLLPLPL
jgi:hypothetical protein